MRAASLVSSVGFLSLVLAFSCSSGESDRTGDQAGVGGNGTGCVPKTCAELGANCGSVGDGCGTLIECGACIDGQTCGAAGPNVCGVGTCTPKDCATQGFTCGQQGDTCGNALTCGECAGACVAGVCQVAGTGGTGTGTGGAAGTGAVSGTGATASTGGTTSLPPGELYGFLPTTVTESEVKGYYDAWKTAWVEDCGNGSARVKWDNTSQTVSEGIGYGMLLAAAWDDKALVDSLFAYYTKAKNANGLMHWKIDGCGGNVSGTGAATDADLDAAMALLIANCKWPGQGYDTSATAIISAIRNKVMKADGAHTFLCAGDEWGGDCCGNASYQAPGYYRAFGNFTGDATFWNKAADDSYYYLEKNDNDTTRLVSDWMDPDSLKCDAKGWGDWHGWDASRVPWRVATDYVWWGTQKAQEYGVTNSNWMQSKGGIASSCQGYNLAGTQCGGTAVSTFAGAFATSAIANSQELSNAFFQDLKGVEHAGYFNEILRTLYFTLAVGKFTYCSGE